MLLLAVLVRRELPVRGGTCLLVVELLELMVVELAAMLVMLVGLVVEEAVVDGQGSIHQEMFIILLEVQVVAAAVVPIVLYQKVVEILQTHIYLIQQQELMDRQLDGLIMLDMARVVVESVILLELLEVDLATE